MSTVKFYKTPGGEEIAILPRAEYEALTARAGREGAPGTEAAEDAMTARIVDRAAETGGASLPLDVWETMAGAPSPIGPLRRFRKMTQAELAAAAAISQGYLSEIECGDKTGDVNTLRRIAAALGVGIEDVLKLNEGENWLLQNQSHEGDTSMMKRVERITLPHFDLSQTFNPDGTLRRPSNTPAKPAAKRKAASSKPKPRKTARRTRKAAKRPKGKRTA